MKKIIKGLAVVLAVSVMLFTLVGCKTDDTKDAEINTLQQQLKELYEKLQYLEQTEKPGANGQDGKTPYIGRNSNWWIGNIDTGIKAEGTPGKPGTDGTNGQDGKTPHIGANNNWWIGDVDTGVKAEGTNGTDGANGQDGTNGQDGKTPFIGGNGNWWIGTTDTGVKAEGTNGTDGANGSNGQDGVNGQDGKTPFIGSNGNWWIGDVDTGVKAEGLTDKDQENLDNLIASNIYTKQKEFQLGEQLDIYCNGEIIVSLRLIYPEIHAEIGFNAYLEIVYVKYAQPILNIVDWFRIECVSINELTGVETSAFAPRVQDTKTDIIQAGGGGQRRYYFAWGGGSVTNATYFNVFIAIPGTYIPIASINNIIKADLPPAL